MSRQALLVSVLSALAFGGGAILPLAATATPQPHASAAAPVATGTHVRWSGFVLAATQSPKQQCYVLQGAHAGIGGAAPSPGAANPDRFAACQDFHSPTPVAVGELMIFRGVVTGTAGLEIGGQHSVLPVMQAAATYAFAPSGGSFGGGNSSMGNYVYRGGMGPSEQNWGPSGTR